MTTSLSGATGNSSRIKGTPFQAIDMGGHPRNRELWEQTYSQLQPGFKGGIDFLSSLAAGGNEGFWNQLEAPAMRNFQNWQSQQASQFSGIGTGSRRSSGFANTLSGGAADLAERLQAQRLGLQFNAISGLSSMFSDLMGNTPYERFITERKRKNPWGNLFSGASEGALAGSQLHPIWGTLGGTLAGGVTGYFGGRQ